MNLEITLQMLASQLQIDPDKLIEYAREADELDIGGYHWQAEKQRGIHGILWPSGSLWAVEGATLYALVRYFKYNRVAEIGGWYGCSATHIAAALERNWQDAKEHGEFMLYSVDAHVLGDVGQTEHGSLIPSQYRSFVTLVSAYGQDWLGQQEDESVQLVFSDADHSTQTTRLIAEAAKPKIANGGLFIEHDAAHDFYVDGLGNRYPDNNHVGAVVRAGLDAAGLNYRVYLTEPSDCGLAIARIEHAESVMTADRETELSSAILGRGENSVLMRGIVSTEPLKEEKPKRELVTVEGDTLEVIEPPPVEKVKRTRRKRNAKTGELE